MNAERSAWFSGLLVVVGLWPLSAHAYRPFNGTDAAVADKGEVELELGPLGFVKEGPDRFLVAPSVTFTVRPVAELVVEAERDLPTALSGLAGAIWRVREGLALDAGVRLARAGGVSTTEVRAGLTWAFAVGVPR